MISIYSSPISNNGTKKLNQNLTGLSFKSSNSTKVMSAGSEMVGRRMINIFGDIFERESSKIKRQELLDENISEIDRYIKAGRIYGSNMDIEINTESGLLKEIADTDQASVFIMNHDNQRIDPLMLLIFNTLLSEMYKLSGKSESFPRSRIILNEDILKSMNSEKRELMEKLGAIGIDASLRGKDEIKNARKLLPVLKDFANDKVNIYIFPEGKLSAYKGHSMESKFQNGIGEIVLKQLSQKPEVQVVPLGFAYPKSKNEGSIYIGNPIRFKKENGVVLNTRGNITESKYGKKSYREFYENHKEEKYVPILKDGEPISERMSVPYISGILCENLEICRSEAKEQITKLAEGESILV